MEQTTDDPNPLFPAAGKLIIRPRLNAAETFVPVICASLIMHNYPKMRDILKSVRLEKPRRLSSGQLNFICELGFFLWLVGICLAVLVLIVRIAPRILSPETGAHLGKTER